MSQLLAELFSAYYKDIYTYLYSLSHDASLSEDLASEVFLEAIKSISSFRGEANIKTWLFSIARHQWFAYLRKKNRQIQTQSIHDLYDSSQPAALDDHDLRIFIDQLLEQETAVVRSVFRLRLDGYSYFEIGEKLGISENSARVIYFRTRNKIKTYLQKEGF